MTVRARLTLWYVGVMFISLLAMAALSYNEFALERPPAEPTAKNAGADSDADGPDNPVMETLSILLWCGLPAAALAVVGGWWLMRKAIAPVEAVTRAAERINENNLAEQLPCGETQDEFDRLTRVFNGMTSRLHDSFRRVHEFTLHASHELKTPLTVLRGQLEGQLLDDHLTGAQRECVASELEEVHRLTRIVEGLTLLTKADAGQVRLNLEPVPLDELVRDAVADAQILAKASNITVALGECEPHAMRGDRDRLRQLLLNLTDNAVKYNEPGGNVMISLRSNGDGAARMAIVNTGRGIAPESLPRVFDRFYRGDASHNNAVEGCGLGLSIAKWIVDAHRGEIQITSGPWQPTKVVVLFPKTQTEVSPPGD